jgi:multiple sugar transport system permease protein
MTNRTVKASPPRFHRKWRQNLIAYLFILPFFLFMLAFGIGPGIYAFIISFAKFKTGVPQFFTAGLNNYIGVFKDFRFLFTGGNIGKFLVVSVPLGIALVVLIALLLHMRTGRIASILRTIYFIPGAVTGPALLLLAIFMFSPNMSPFGSLIRGMGYDSFDALIAPSRLPVIFTVIGFFSGAGMWIVIQFGALEGISAEVLEASKIDGCNAWQQALYIKFPLIRPYVIYQFILIFAGNVQLFVEPQLMGTTWINANVPQQWAPNQLAYSFAFDIGNFGMAAAMSLLMLVIGLVAAYFVIRWTHFFDIKA